MESCTFYTLEPAQSRADEIHLLALVQLLSSITAPGGSHGDQNRLALSARVTGGDPPRESALSIHSSLRRLGLARHTLVRVQHLTSIPAPGAAATMTKTNSRSWPESRAATQRGNPHFLYTRACVGSGWHGTHWCAFSA